MPSPHKRKQPDFRGPEEGFALIISLGLMGFVVLLLTSLLTTTMVETRAADKRLQKLRAEQNAVLGMRIALGELQRHAGPDQRVSARGELAGAGAGQGLWTGIWNTDTGGPPTWLVSTPDGPPEGDPGNAALGQEPVTLSAAPGTDPETGAAEVGRVFLEPAAPDKQGAYAFWVEDEGVKADISVVGDEPVFPESDFLNGGSNGTLGRAERSALRSYLMQSGHRVATETILKQPGGNFTPVSVPDFNQASRADAEKLRRLPSFPSINHLAPDSAEDADSKEDLAARLHADLGHRIRGVLADTEGGGLRRNLEDLANSKVADPSANDPFINGDLLPLDPDAAAYANPDRNFTSVPTEQFGNVPGLVAYRDPGRGQSPAENFATGFDKPGVGRTLPADPADPAEGFRAYHNVSPVITAFRIVAAVFENPSGTPSLRYEIDLELYNPYARPLLLNPRHKHALSVFVEGLPEVKIIRENANGELLEESGWRSLDRAPQYSSGSSTIDSWLQIAGEQDEDSGPAYLNPGEVYRIREPIRSGGIRKELGNVPSDVADKDRIRLETRSSTNPDDASDGRLRVRLVRGSHFSGATPLPNKSGNERPAFFEIDNVPYDAEGSFDYNGTFADGSTSRGGGNDGGGRGRGRPPPGGGAEAARYYKSGARFGGPELDSIYTFAIHFSLGFEPSNPNDPGAEFLRFFDLRTPRIDYEDEITIPAADGETEQTIPVSDFFILSSANIFEALNDFNIPFNQSATNIFWDNGDGTTRDQNPGNYGDARLYDLPGNRPTNIAAFRHAYFVGLPPQSLGGPRGGGLNKAFDRYFLSTVPESGWTPGDGVRLPNMRLIPHSRPSAPPPSAGDLRAEDAAASMLVDGSFNLNSTSVNAWRAHLGQSAPNSGQRPNDFSGRAFRITDEERGRLVQPRSVHDWKNAFYRFPFAALDLTPAREDLEQSGGEEPTPLFDLEPFALRRESTRQGVRVLGDEHGDNQIHQLAHHLVEKLKERAEPFVSIADFLNSGLLRDAIAAVGPAVETADRSIPETPSINRDLRGFEPTYLLQSDVFAPLASFASARSDTFTIRARGEVANPITGRDISTALLETRVQRVPQFADPGPGDPMENATAANGGRDFRIVSQKWIQE